MFKRIKINGYILDGEGGSLYFSEHEWNVMSLALGVHELIKEGSANYFDLSDPYFLYDKFYELNDPIESLLHFLSSVRRLPSSTRDGLMKGFESYKKSTI